MSLRAVASGVVLPWAAAQWAFWWRWAETHCWACDAEVAEDAEQCAVCGRDLQPF